MCDHERIGCMDELVRIGNGALTASISSLGAELKSLKDAAGGELMTDADPRWWTGHAPLLFPFVGRLAGDHYRLDGRSYPMPQHGFARRRSFALVNHDSHRACFRLDADDETRNAYPFEFRVDMRFEVAGTALLMEACVENRGDADMPFSFGFHPAFAWPLPHGASASSHRLLFDAEEPAPVRRVADGTGLIAEGAEATPVAGRLLQPTPAMFERDALIWDRIESRGLLWGPPDAPNLRVEFPDTPWLGLWQKPGAHYLCIEPWAGMADPLRFEGDVWQKPGIMRLGPGEGRSFRMNVMLTKPDGAPLAPR